MGGNRTAAPANNCRAGIYVRLSREDEAAGESASIANQKDFLTQYVRAKGWELAGIYQDDGFSGTDFDRPGFKSMLEAIENKKINTVVTRDLSRLGRDYIGTGFYLEKYFPEHGIRYIAVNDGIDTFSTGAGDDMTPFRAVINDMYARDISKKVRSVFENKRQNGEFIGSFAPYGYKKHPLDRNRLVVDEEAGQVVRLIFDLFIKGHGYSGISRILNGMGIPCPAIYKSSTCNYRNPKLKAGMWTHETVRKILLNPTYAGDMAQGKYKKVGYKVNKQINVPADSWVVVRDKHPAIVDRHIYEEVQEIIKQKPGYCGSEAKAHLLGGMVYCGECGARMTFHNVKGRSYCICSSYRRFGKNSCSSHSVQEEALEEYVCNRLGSLAKEFCDLEELVKLMGPAGAPDAKNADAAHTAAKAGTEAENTVNILKLLYEDRRKGIITEEDFVDLYKSYTAKRKTLLEKAAYAEAGAGHEACNENKVSELRNNLAKLLSFSEPAKEFLMKLVDRIQVFENETEKRILVGYRFKVP